MWGGCDLLWAGAVDAPTLARLMTTAHSIHVTPVVMARTADELRQALAAESFIIGLASPNGKLDTAHVSALPPRSRGGRPSSRWTN